MKKYNLVIAETDNMYVNNLMNFISQNYSYNFNIVCFTEKEYFMKYIEKGNKAEILLINPELYYEGINSDNFELVVALLDNNSTGFKGFNSIKKYQSADKICNELIRLYEAKNGSNEKSGEGDISTKIITYYSPIGGIGKTTLALSTALSLTKAGKKVIYVNLEDIQSTSAFFDSVNSNASLSDIIYSIKERTDKFKEVLLNTVSEDNKTGIFYFGMVDSVLDIEELTSEDLKELLENLIKVNIYDYVIIDLGTNLNSNYGCILSKSLNVIVPIGQDRLSSGKIDTMLNQIEDTDNFVFLINKLKKDKERILPKTVVSQIRPIIQTIDYDDGVEGNCELGSYYLNAKAFMDKIEELTQNKILYF